MGLLSRLRLFLCKSVGFSVQILAFFHEYLLADFLQSNCLVPMGEQKPVNGCKL